MFVYANLKNRFPNINIRKQHRQQHEREAHLEEAAALGDTHNNHHADQQAQGIEIDTDNAARRLLVMLDTALCSGAFSYRVSGDLGTFIFIFIICSPVMVC